MKEKAQPKRIRVDVTNDVHQSMRDKPEKDLACEQSDPVPRIVTIRGQKVILDSDLAGIYGVETYRFNEAVKRNGNRFPEDFMFQLTPEEFAVLISQNAMSKIGRGGRRTPPYAFTEHGAVMAANVLHSERAVQMSVFVVRAFIRMRVALADTRDLAKKLAELEKELKARLDVHESAIVDTLQRIMEIIDPPALPEPPRKSIGFQSMVALGTPPRAVRARSR